MSDIEPRKIASNDASLTNEEWAAQFPSVSNWAGHLESRESALSILRQWHEWLTENGEELMGLSPDQLVDRQDSLNENGSRRQRYLINDRILQYIRAQERWRLGTKRKTYGTIRGFFEFNHVELPRDKTARFRSSVDPTPEVMADEWRKGLQVLKQVLLKSNRMYRAIFMVILEGSMGLNEILEWSGRGIKATEETLATARTVQGFKIIKITFPRGRKTNLKAFYTLLGGDSMVLLEDYLKERKRRQDAYERKTGARYPSDLFVTNTSDPLDSDNTIQVYWLNKLLQLGIVDRTQQEGSSRRYGFHLHQLRDVFKTLCQRTGVDDKVSEFLLGHQIDPLKYNHAMNEVDYVAKEYVKVLPFLDIWSSDRAFGKVDEDEVESLRQYARDLEEKLKKQEAEFEEKLGEERSRRLNIETKLITQEYDVEGLKRGHADLKASFIVRTEREKKLEDRIIELEGQLAARNGQVQDLRSEFQEFKKELEKRARQAKYAMLYRSSGLSIQPPPSRRHKRRS